LPNKGLDPEASAKRNEGRVIGEIRPRRGASAERGKKGSILYRRELD
jgi:hypothetical protein